MTKKLAQLLLNNETFMNNIPLSWGLKLENYVNHGALNYCEVV